MPDRQKTMLLTGASRGIGHATAKLFAQRGWRVLTVSRHPFDPACAWPGGAANHLQADLSEPDACERLITKVRSRINGEGIDALINNAGISPKEIDGSRMSALKTDYRTWIHVFNVNFFAPVILAQGLLQELRMARGVIVNVTSIAGFRVHPFAGTAYACSKAALAALTRELAHEYGPHGVRVNAIAPGEIHTSILSPATNIIVEKQIPMGRLGEPAEVAEVVMFMCSSSSVYVNGAEIQINGGQHV